MLSSAANKPIIASNPVVSRTILYRGNPLGFITTIIAMRRFKPDLTVDMLDRGSITSSWLLLLSGAPRRASLRRLNFNFGANILIDPPQRGESRMIERTACLGQIFGIDIDKQDIVPYVPLDDASGESAKELLRGLEHPLVGVNISAGAPERSWGRHNIERLIRGLKSAGYDGRLVILATGRDAELARQLSDEFNVFSVSGLSLMQFAALISQLNYLITADTGTVHLADAFGVRQIILYGNDPVNIADWTPVLSPYRAAVSPDSKRIHRIEPDAVITLFLNLVGEQEGRGGAVL